MSELPDAVPRRGGPRTPLLVWIIPVVALLVGGWLALQGFMNRGPDIVIQFRSAEGIEAGKTRIRYKSVDIGTVKSVKLSDDNTTVLVTAEIDRESSKRFLVDDTRFWVVRPRIVGGQISGLGTLLAGSYIGAEPGKAKNERSTFVGLETPPVITSDLPGKTFVLHAEDLGSLDVNSPVYFRGVLAGRVVSTEVPADGKEVRIGVFVDAPYDKQVTPETRFWNASGAELGLDANGVRVEVQSLITLLLGGVAFGTPSDVAVQPPAKANAEFTLFDNQAKAFRPRETVIETVVLKFAQSVRGLQIGSAVDFRGINVGEVKRIDLEFDPQQVRFLTVVEVDLYPERLRSRFREPTRAPLPNLTPLERIQRFVDRGLRAQLKNSNLLTGQLYVALEFFPKAPKATMNLAQKPPEIPTVGGGLGDLQESVANIAAKLEKVPFDKLAEDLRKSLAALEASLKSADVLMKQLSAEVAPEIKAALAQGRKTLDAAEKILANDSPVQGDLRETLIEVRKAAESVRTLTDYLERHPESLIRGKRGDPK
jgi:paraquat-inducible protein B